MSQNTATTVYFNLEKNYRIREWFGLKVTFKGYLLQPPYNEQQDIQLYQIAKNPV